MTASDESDSATQVPLAAITCGLLLGGSSTFLINLCRSFKRRGYTLPVVNLSPVNQYLQEFAALGAAVHDLPWRRSIYEDRVSFAYRVLARFSPGAVLSCLGSESFEPLRLVPPGVARLGMVQSDDPGPYRVVCQYAPHLDAIIGVSREIVRNIERIPALGARARYIPYGVEFSVPPSLPSREPLDPLRLVYVGRLLEEQKRVSRLAALIRLLHEHRLNVRFTFVGSGAEEGRLRQELQGVSFVEFAGTLPYGRVLDVMRQHDVFVLLSDYEGLPLSLIEAMGCGLVPVVSDLPSGIRDIVSDECGYRVPVGDVQQAFHAISHLMRHPSTLQSLSQAAARIAREHYSADRMAARFLTLASEVSRRRVEWPRTTAIPVPLGMQPRWLYQGIGRFLRRNVKRLLG